MIDPTPNDALRDLLGRELAKRRLLVETLDEIQDAPTDGPLLAACHQELGKRRKQRHLIRLSAYATYAAAAALAFLLVGLFLTGLHESTDGPTASGGVPQDPQNELNGQRMVQTVVLTNARPQTPIHIISEPQDELANRSLLTVIKDSAPTLMVIAPAQPRLTSLQEITDEELLRMPKREEIVALVGYSPDQVSALVVRRTAQSR